MSRHDERDYYTIEEAMKILGMKKSKFYQEVEEGKIPFDLPPGKTIGMRFPKEGIDILAKRERKKRSQRQAVHLVFKPSTTADIWIAVSNARRVYGPDDVISFERALEWRDINPDISMSVKQGKHLAGMVTYLPLDERVALALLRDDLRERDIPDEAIRQWTDPQISVYIAGIASISSGDAQVDSLRGRFLLAHSIKWAITLTAQYDIKNWYSIGVTPEGQAIAEALGFREILSLEEGKRKGYVLEHMLTQPTRLVQRYLSNIEG
ncbi:MAG TPA: helix-turn-helix domain-containing protein [Ktedonobacteraceae bacterium]|nr:helix-turn-helix domain-containing protein [Ktedonobacteraceae bacterium]